LGEADRYNLISLEDFGDFSPKLLKFLNSNYHRDFKSDYPEMIFTMEYLEWFFLFGGFLGVLLYDDEWIGIVICSRKKMKFHNETEEVFITGPVCIKPEFRSLKHIKLLILTFGKMINTKYGLTGTAAGVTNMPFRKPPMHTVYRNFKIGICTDIQPPKEKIFSTNNFHLLDTRDSFLDRHEEDDGWVLCHPQKVNFKGKTWNRGVIVSYFSEGSWNELIYKAIKKTFLKKYDEVMLFENHERTFDSMKEMGFTQQYLYSFYLYSSVPVGNHYLYYNTFTF
tara:strand:+ start:1914 stop:2756 length:843 start_codon:yes stop_codon:yes gene_type:complete